jgi:nicotinate-nucleotide adenylyltransferase
MTEAAKPARIGLFGGTFNPIHMGHLRAAEEVSERLDLERLVFLPCAQPPHKRGTNELLAPARERLEWVRLAIAGNPRFAVDPIELAREGPSYSVDTLRALRGDAGGEPPIFVIGLDAFAEIDSWREPEELFRLASFAVLTRPPAEPGSFSACLPRSVRTTLTLSADGTSARHPTATTWVQLVEITALDISATDVRARLRDGLSVRYLVPEPVREAILESGTYTTRESA